MLCRATKILLRIPKRAEAQWLRCKDVLARRLAPAGQAIGDSEIHSAAISLLETVLKAGPGIVADDGAPANEARPTPVLPFWPPDDDPFWDGLRLAAPSRRVGRGRSEVADLAQRIDSLGEKIDALVDAQAVDQKK